MTAQRQTKSATGSKQDGMPCVKDAATGPTLSALLEGFEPFQETMLCEARERRENEAQKIAAFKVEMQRLEDRLDESVREQETANAALLNHCKVERDRAEEAFVSLLEHQTHRVHERLDTLEKCAEGLDAKFSMEKERIRRDLGERSRHLTKVLADFHLAFEKERQDRLAREEEIVNDMQSHESRVEDSFVDEEQLLQKTVSDITKELAHISASRRTGNDQLWFVCKRQIQELDHALQDEIKQRGLFDDRIINAMHQYTEKMQTSLDIINIVPEAVPASIPS